jgi:hypothetical protein
VVNVQVSCAAVTTRAVGIERSGQPSAPGEPARAVYPIRCSRYEPPQYLADMEQPPCQRHDLARSQAFAYPWRCSLFHTWRASRALHERIKMHRADQRNSRVPVISLSRLCRELAVITLEPSSYECPEHHTVLTGLVEDALKDDSPPVAYYGLRKTTGLRPFQVIVTCRGADGAGAHQLTCTGTWTR